VRQLPCGLLARDRLGIDIRAPPDQQCRDPGVVRPHGDLQRGLLEVRLPLIDRRAALEQRPGDLRCAAARRDEQRAFACRVSGLITRDIESAYLAFDPGEEAPIDGLLGASITYRIATGPREGQVVTLQTVPASPEGPRRDVAEASGFSLHAAIAAKDSQRDKLEHLARYVSRPPVATERLSLTEGGYLRYALKTPYRDGTTHVIFEP
jgi:hypothetical protein